MGYYSKATIIQENGFWARIHSCPILITATEVQTAYQCRLLFERVTSVQCTLNETLLELFSFKMLFVSFSKSVTVALREVSKKNSHHGSKTLLHSC